LTQCIENNHEIEEEQAPIVDKAAETNNHDQEMAAVTQKPTSSPKEKTPPVADEIVSTAQEKEVAELDQKMESPEKPASPSKGKDVEAPSKDVPSPEKQITNADEAILQTENNAITPESDASGTDQMVIDQEEHIQEEHIQEDDIQEKDIQEKDIQDNIQQDNIQQENIQQESAANEPMPYVDDDNYSIDYYDPGEYDQVEPEHNDKQPNPPAEASSRDKGKRRAVEINTGQSTPPRQFGDDALEQKQIIINWLRVKRNVEHTKKLKSVKIALAILECVLSVVYLTAREAR
jgi:hypothetical protein